MAEQNRIEYRTNNDMTAAMRTCKAHEVKSRYMRKIEIKTRKNFLHEQIFRFEAKKPIYSGQSRWYTKHNTIETSMFQIDRYYNFSYLTNTHRKNIEKLATKIIILFMFRFFLYFFFYFATAFVLLLIVNLAKY